MTDNAAHILVVDDEADEKKLTFELTFTVGESKPRVRHPRDVELTDLQWADIILMDYRIEDWPERDETGSLGLRPFSGVALAAVYRDYIDLPNGKQRLTAVAVYSGHLDDLCGRLPKDRTAHLVARLNNLEWVFQKGEPEVGARVRRLAKAVRELPASWPTEPGKPEALARDLLQLSDDVTWVDRAWEDVQCSQVPLLDLIGGAHGLVFIRWLLHSILPYPTFLWGEPWVAAHLRIQPKSLSEVLDGNSELAAELEELRYRGILADFQGPLWWKGAVEQFAWEIRNTGAQDTAAFHAVLEKHAGGPLERIEATSPCVCVGPDLRPTDVIADVTEVVRLVPDLWPAFADSATALRSDVVDEPSLRAIVHPLDGDAFVDDEE